MRKTYSLQMMDKRGQAEVVGIVFLVSLIIFSGISGYKILSENTYIGDNVTLLYYDLRKCDINNIPKENIVGFKSLKVAINNGYLPAKCSMQ